MTRLSGGNLKDYALDYYQRKEKDDKALIELTCVRYTPFPFYPGTASTSSQSPTPVLLSLPYSENGTFGQQPNRKRGNDRGMIMESGSNNNTSMDYKKMRPLPNDTAAPTIEMEPTFIAMDNTPSPSTPTATAVTKSKGSGRGRKPAHELLSDDQKKANHIASEQKRRANIRLGFDQLVGVVPNLTECQRSESLILQKCK